ncbi:MAG: substrate-binding domain-containing protein, partial [Ruthenibacterium sp.]
MKKLLTLILCAVMALSFAACGAGAASTAPVTSAASASTSEKAEELPTFGVIIFDYANDYCYHVRNGMTKASEGIATLEMVDSQNDQAKQTDQVDTLINKGVSGLLIAIVDPEAAPTIIDKCRAADIPVIFVNRRPDLEAIASYEKCWYVGAATAQPGEAQAQMVLDDWAAHPEFDKNKDGVMQYIVVKGENGHANAEARCTGIEKIFDAANFKRELLDMQPGGWNAAAAKNLMETWYGKFGNEIECILSNNDAMALGIIEALKAEGYFTGDKGMPIYGINAIPEGLDALEDKTLMGTVMSDMISEGACTFQ